MVFILRRGPVYDKTYGPVACREFIIHKVILNTNLKAHDLISNRNGLLKTNHLKWVQREPV